MYKDKKVAIVFSTYNEKDSVKKFINDCFATWVVDEVIAINNNAAKWTYEEIAVTKAIQIIETKQWYGYGYRRGIHEAIKRNNDLIILAEPDWTFLAKDIFKLLAYGEDFSVVFGTRTTSACIGDWANMWFFIKRWNRAVAKMVEMLFNTTHLSDVWCTYKLFHKDVLKKIESEFTVWWSHFWPELMLLIVKHKMPFVEIPVHYIKRIGESSVTWDFRKTFRLWFRMVFFILSRKFSKPHGKKR